MAAGIVIPAGPLTLDEFVVATDCWRRIPSHVKDSRLRAEAAFELFKYVLPDCTKIEDSRHLRLIICNSGVDLFKEKTFPQLFPQVSFPPSKCVDCNHNLCRPRRSSGAFKRIFVTSLATVTNCFCYEAECAHCHRWHTGSYSFRKDGTTVGDPIQNKQGQDDMAVRRDNHRSHQRHHNMRSYYNDVGSRCVSRAHEQLGYMTEPFISRKVLC